MSVTAENQPAINMLKAEEERNEMLGGSRVVQGETGWYRKQQAKASKEAEWKGNVISQSIERTKIDSSCGLLCPLLNAFSSVSQEMQSRAGGAAGEEGSQLIKVQNTLALLVLINWR